MLQDCIHEIVEILICLEEIQTPESDLQLFDFTCLGNNCGLTVLRKIDVILKIMKNLKILVH